LTVYAQINFFGTFMFLFLVLPKDILKTAGVDKR